MPSVTIRSKNNPNIVYTYDYDNLIFDQSRIAMAFVGKQMVNGCSSDVIIQVYDFSNISEIWKRRRPQHSIVNFAKKSRNSFIDIFFDDTSNCSREYMYLIREFHQEITLENFLSGKNLNNFSDAQKTLYQNLSNHNRFKAASDILLGILSKVQDIHNWGLGLIDIHPSTVIVNSKCEIELLDSLCITKHLKNYNGHSRLCSSPSYISIEYASPEEILGEWHNLTLQTDFYAIGILYFQLITGDLPFSGETIEVLQAQLRKSIPTEKISHPQIRKIIKKATEKNIKKRFSSCADFTAAIQDIDFSEGNRYKWWQKLFK